MIKAIIFDLNGVFIKSRNLSERFAEDFGVAQDEFLVALRQIMSRVRQPNAIECFECWQPFLQKWGIDFSNKDFYDYWFGHEKIDSELVGYAKELSSREIKLFILSNNFRERSQYYLKHFSDFMGIFEKVYFSWQTGHQKPGHEAFLDILNEHNLQADECLFFDDSPENVETAKSLGLNAFVYSSPDQAWEIIQNGYLPETNVYNREADGEVPKGE